MGEELNERSRRILEAIIEDYIGTAEPIGSRAVTKRHPLGLSPATVRNVMADLEELGFLASPHTSAGRVPTEKAYRFYVDSLLQVGPLTNQQRQNIDRHYHGQGLRVEERLREAGKVLSAISSYAGVVMAPRFTSTVFRHIEFVLLSRGKVLVIFVSRSGMVQNKLIETAEEIGQRELEEVAGYLNRTLSGLTIQQAKERLVEEMVEDKALYDTLMRRVLDLSREILTEEMGEQVYIEGASNILEQPEFADVERMKRLFRTFEQKSLLVELLDKSQRAQGVNIFIGSETEYSEIAGCSLITSSYTSPRGTIGTLGVIGPTRMPYSRVIPIVDYTARLVSQVLEIDSE